MIRQLPAGVHDTQLLDAFRNQSVTTILLASDYAVGSQFDNYAGPYQEGSPIIPVNRSAGKPLLTGGQAFSVAAGAGANSVVELRLCACCTCLDKEISIQKPTATSYPAAHHDHLEVVIFMG